MKLKVMGDRKGIKYYQEITLVLLISHYFISCSSSILETSPSRPLVYGGDYVLGITYYCEFATMGNFKLGAYSKKCRTQNPDTKMIRNGKEYYPWRKFSVGSGGILLQCLPPVNVSSFDCTESFNVYSSCTFSCTEGYEKNNQTAECKVNGPLNNVSAIWSLDVFCKKGATNNNIMKDDAVEEENQNIKFLILFSCILVAVVFILYCWKKYGSCKRSPSEYGSSVGTNSSIANMNQTPNGSSNGVNSSMNLIPSAPDSENVHPTGMSDMHILTVGDVLGPIYSQDLKQNGIGEDDCEKALYAHLLAALFSEEDVNAKLPSACDDRDKSTATEANKAISCHGGSDKSSKTPASASQEEGMAKFFNIHADGEKASENAEGVVTTTVNVNSSLLGKSVDCLRNASGVGDKSTEAGDDQVEESGRLLCVYGDSDEGKDLEAGLSDAPSLPCVQEMSFCELGKDSDCCDEPISAFYELRARDFRKLTSYLEYFGNKRKEETLYGYMLDNWKAYGFVHKEVELYQSSQPHLRDQTPFEFFFQKLSEYRTSIRELLNYFAHHRAEESVNILLEFHDCVHCKKLFKVSIEG